jgi:translation initiation factor 2 subunit 1
MLRNSVLPKLNDVVMVVATKITDLGVYVTLPEYHDVEGLILLSDLSKGRFKTITKIVSVGKMFPANVQLIDEENNRLTLGKKHVSESDAKKCTTDYKVGKLINDQIVSFIKRMELDHSINVNRIDAYKAFIWNLDMSSNSDPISNDNTESIINDPHIVLTILKAIPKGIIPPAYDNIDPIWLKCFVSVLSKKFTERNVLIEAVIEVNCFSYGGINTIKNALLKGAELATTEIPFVIKLIKSPFYSISIKTTKQSEAIELINKAIDVITEEITTEGGLINITKQAEMVIDDKEYVVEDLEPEPDSDLDDDEYDEYDD